MPENFYHSLLGLDPEVSTPDYYQLLDVPPQATLDVDAIERGYKAQMLKAQQIRSPKYKDLVEFLKGELKAARRTLSDSQARQRYEEERRAEAAERLRDVIIMFIQTSGNLSEIEVGEIHRRARLLNVPKREANGLIDEMLASFGCQRIKASAEQMKRAGQIMTLRAQHHGKAAADFAIQDFGDGHADAVESGRHANDGARAGSGTALRVEARKLQRQASRRARWAPVMFGVRMWNALFGLTAVAVGLAVAAFVVSPGAFRGPIEGQLGDGGLHLFYDENRPHRQALQALADAETARRLAEERATTAERRYAEVHEPPTPLQRIHDAHVRGDQGAVAEALAAAVDDDEVWRFYANVVVPAQVQYQPRWTWSMRQDHAEFRAAHATATDEGLRVTVPAGEEPLAIPFGGAFKAGIVEVRGRWMGDGGAFGLGFYRPGPDGRALSPIEGALTIDPRAGARAMSLAVFEPPHVANEIAAARRELTVEDGPRAFRGTQFIVRLTAARLDDMPRTDSMYARLIGVLEQAGVRSGVGSAGDVRVMLEPRRANGEWIGASATGRLELRFGPGCDVLLERIDVR